MADGTRRVFVDTIPEDQVAAIIAPRASSPNRHVLPNTKGWKIIQPENDEPLAVFDKKTDAVAAARLMCIESHGELFVHGKDGKIQSRNSYGNDSPDREG